MSTLDEETPRRNPISMQQGWWRGPTHRRKLALHEQATWRKEARRQAILDWLVIGSCAIGGLFVLAFAGRICAWLVLR